MQKKNLLLVLLFMAQIHYSQVRIGSGNPINPKIKKSAKQDTQKFLSKKTHFILPDKFTKNEYEKILSVWKTPYDITFLKNFNETDYQIGDAYAIMKTQIKNTIRTKVDRKTNHPVGDSRSRYMFFNTLELFILEGSKVKKTKTSLLSKSKKKIVYLKKHVGAIFFTSSSQFDLSGKYAGFKNINYNVDLQTFELGYLKNFLQQTHSALKENKTIEIFKDFNTTEISNLKSEILYVSKEQLLKTNESDPPSNVSDDYTKYMKRYNSRREEFEKALDDKINTTFKNYEFKYEFISDKELNEKILNSNKKFYYILGNRINMPKIITITNSETGNLIFSRYKSGLIGYSINKKDIKALNKQILNK